MHQSERIVRQLTNAFTEAAPWYSRWGVRINTFIQTRAKAAGDLIKQYAPTALAESYAESIKEKFKAKKVGHLVDPDDLDTTLRKFGAPLTLPHWFQGQTIRSIRPLGINRCRRCCSRLTRTIVFNSTAISCGRSRKKCGDKSRSTKRLLTV